MIALFVVYFFRIEEKETNYPLIGAITSYDILISELALCDIK